MARMLSNGAIVDDSGQWYWTGNTWKALLTNPTSKQPGAVLGKDRRDVAHLLRGRGLMEMGKVRDAGEELMQLVFRHGSVQTAEQALLGGAASDSAPDGAAATSKAGSKLALVGDQLVLTTAADKGGMFSKPRPERTVAIPLGRAQLRTDKFGNAWVYDRTDLVETLEACQPIATLEEIAQKVTAVAPPAQAGVATLSLGVEVKTYHSEHDYERDARSRISAGWRPQTVTSGRGKVNMGRTLVKAGLFLPWAVMRPSRQGDPLTVTWAREQSTGGPTMAQPAAGPAPAATDLLTQLERLGKLRETGVLTEEEFQAQKDRLLAAE